MKLPLSQNRGDVVHPRRTEMTLRISLAALIALGLVFTATATAQFTLTTTFANNNGCMGNQFDIVAIGGGVTINSFDVNLNTGVTDTVQVWAVTGGGTFVGNETNPAAWTMLGQAMVTSNGTGTPTPLNLNLAYLVPAGVTQGFHVSATTANNISYTNGTAVGAIAAQDTEIQILEGIGHCTPLWGSPIVTRVVNTTVHYGPAGPTIDYQVNQAEASLAINAMQGTATAAAMPLLTSGTPALALFSSTNTGAPWELIFGLSPLVTATGGGIVDPEGQIVNIDLTDPTLTFLFNGFQGPGFATAALPFTPTAAASLSIQMAVADPIAIVGLRVSQPTRITVQ